MPRRSPNLVLALHNLNECWWECKLSAGGNGATLSVSYSRSSCLLALLQAVQALLDGVRKMHYSWDADYGIYRWRFTCHDQ